MSTKTANDLRRNDKPGEVRKMEPVFEVVDFDTLSPAEEAFGDAFDSMLIGQPEARRIALEIRARHRNPTRNKEVPLGVYYFIGKSRRGKSRFAQVLAKIFHGSEKALIRVTSEDYYDESQMNDLRGAPPKYVGYREPVDWKKLKKETLAQVDGYSKVSDWNRQRVRLDSGEEIDIVVIEEFAKSGRDFYKFWMEVFDKGGKTLANGEYADFSNTVFIITDNLGMDKVEKEESGKTIGFRSGEKKVLTPAEVEAIVREEMKRFPPEFRNRIDEMCIFRELTADETMQIVHIQVQMLKDRIMDQMKRGDDFELDVTQSACDFLLKESDEDVANLKRTLLRFVEAPLGRMLDKDNPEKVLGGDLVRVSWDGKSKTLTFQVARGAGEIDTNLEGLRRFLGDTDETQKGLAFQRRLSKVRGAVARSKQEDWTITLASDELAEVQSAGADLFHDLKEIYGFKVTSFSASFETPYVAVFIVRGSQEQVDLFSQMNPECTVKKMSRALVPVEPKKS